jgi:hypothetical protein
MPDSDQLEADAVTAYVQAVKALAVVFRYTPYEAPGFYSAQAVLESAEEAGVIDGAWRGIKSS